MAFKLTMAFTSVYYRNQTTETENDSKKQCRKTHGC